MGWSGAHGICTPAVHTVQLGGLRHVPKGALVLGLDDDEYVVSWVSQHVMTVSNEASEYKTRSSSERYANDTRTCHLRSENARVLTEVVELETRHLAQEDGVEVL